MLAGLKAKFLTKPVLTTPAIICEKPPNLDPSHERARIWKIIS